MLNVVHKLQEGLCKPGNEVDRDYIRMMMNSEVTGYRIEWPKKVRIKVSIIFGVLCEIDTELT